MICKGISVRFFWKICIKIINGSEGSYWKNIGLVIHLKSKNRSMSGEMAWKDSCTFPMLVWNKKNLYRAIIVTRTQLCFFFFFLGARQACGCRGPEKFHIWGTGGRSPGRRRSICTTLQPQETCPQTQGKLHSTVILFFKNLYYCCTVHWYCPLTLREVNFLMFSISIF